MTISRAAQVSRASRRSGRRGSGRGFPTDAAPCPAARKAAGRNAGARAAPGHGSAAGRNARATRRRAAPRHSRAAVRNSAAVHNLVQAPARSRARRRPAAPGIAAGRCCRRRCRRNATGPSARSVHARPRGWGRPLVTIHPDVRAGVAVGAGRNSLRACRHRHPEQREAQAPHNHVLHDPPGSTIWSWGDNGRVRETVPPPTPFAHESGGGRRACVACSKA